jgi:hypothetical protein
MNAAQVHEYDELEFQRDANPRDHMVNVWGYSTINFFAPMTRFAANSGGAAAARMCVSTSLLIFPPGETDFRSAVVHGISYIHSSRRHPLACCSRELSDTRASRRPRC